jgi:phosphotriesterase-related protein
MLVQTASGPLPVDKLGPTLMHEHLVIAFTGWEGDVTAPVKPHAEIVARCVDRIEAIKAEGFTSLLDPIPIDLGRDVNLYAEVAARTGFNILFATGLYNEHLGSAYWRAKLAYDPAGADYLAAMYVTELTDGVGGTGLKPAVIKLAIGLDPNSALEAQMIKAAAMASNRTGTPILTHTEGVGGDILLGKLTDHGVPAHRIIIGHSCGSTDQAYHRRITDGGAYIGFDRFGVDYLQSDEARTENLFSLLQDGYDRQVIVSHDCAFCQRGQIVPDEVLKTDPTLFSRQIAPRLRAMGVPQSTLDGILRDNPRRYFCDEVPAAKAATANGRPTVEQPVA